MLLWKSLFINSSRVPPSHPHTLGVEDVATYQSIAVPWGPRVRMFVGGGMDGWDIAQCTLDWKERPHFKYVYSIILCVKAAVFQKLDIAFMNK